MFINCLIVNPTFDSQTKENMTLLQSKFGSKCALSPKFFTAVQKSGEKGEIHSFFRQFGARGRRGSIFSDSGRFRVSIVASKPNFPLQ